MSKLERLPVVTVVEGWFWREYRNPDGSLIERHGPLKVFRDETRAIWSRTVGGCLFRLGLWLVRNGAIQCPDCNKTHNIPDVIR